jgi:hypothetical protein
MTLLDTDYSIEKLIKTGVDEGLKDVHTTIPALVVSFNATTQLADVQPTIKRKLGDDIVNLPLLVDVPVRFMKSANFSVTIPIVAGDYVFVSFCERSIDKWLIDGGLQPADNTRKHHLSDAFAFPMMFSQQEKIVNFNATGLELRSTDGLTRIVLTPTGNIELWGNVLINGSPYVA